MPDGIDAVCGRRCVVKLQRAWIVILWGAVVALPAVDAGEPRGAVAPVPILVLVQPGAANDAVDPLLPLFLVFADGRAIVGQRTAERMTYVTRRLADDELSRFNGTITDVVGDPDFDERLVYAMDRASSAESFFYIGGGGGVGVCAHVSGFSPLFDRSDARLLNPQVANFPYSMRRLYRLVVDFDLSRMEAWLPASGVAEFSPFDGAAESPVPWPNGWPGLPEATNAKGAKSFRVMIDARLLAEVERLLGTPRRGHPVALAGKTWTVNLRPQFPGEDAWRERLEQLTRQRDARPRPPPAVAPSAGVENSTRPKLGEPEPALRKATLKELAPPISLPPPQINVAAPKS